MDWLDGLFEILAPRGRGPGLAVFVLVALLALGVLAYLLWS